MRVTSYHRSPRHYRTRQKKTNNLLKFARLLSLVAIFITTGCLYFVSYGENKEVENETVTTYTVSMYTTNSKQETSNVNRNRLTPRYETIQTLYRETNDIDKVTSSLGDSIITLSKYTLTNFDLPNSKYPGMDFSSFQPYMDYSLVTNKSTQAYKVCHSENAYTDKNGLRRMRVPEGEFKIDGHDDYIVALGTFYKEKGTAGQRYLVVTTTGMFTIVAGDEKSDNDTDTYNMVTTHAKSSSMIEWIVDTRVLDETVKTSGDVTESSVPSIKGDILYIYRIDKKSNI